MPVFRELYQRVKSGKEAERVIKACGRKNYQEQLGRELARIGNSEMWTAGAAVRALRPKNRRKTMDKKAKGISGRKSN
jgi:ketol-acid reductoisomerase